MTILESKLNPRSADFASNAAAMTALVDDLRAQVAKVAEGGGEAARAKHTARGKLLPRDRVEQLLDAGPAWGYLIEGHGLYAWGLGMGEARRHLEAFEFLLACELDLLNLRRLNP